MAITDVEDALVDACNLLDQRRASIEDDVEPLYQPFLDECVGDRLDPAGNVALSALRATDASILSREVAQAILTPILFQYGQEIGSPAASRGDLRGVLYDVWRSRSLAPRTIKSRNITRGTPSYDGGNTGSGLITNLYVDRYGYPIEPGFVETTTLRCIRDGNTGAQRHAEVFQLDGETAAIDAINAWEGGSGLRSELTSHHAGSSGAGRSLLRNAAFSDYNASGDETTKFPGWTLSAAASFSQDATVFRGFPGSSENTSGGPTAASLEFEASGSAVQRLSVTGTRLDPDKPYFLRCMVQRLASATGTITLAFGAATAAVALSSLTNGVWTELAIAATANSWPDTGTEANMDIAITAGSLATGTALIGDVLFAPYQYVNGAWRFLRGGATAWLRDDLITIADTGGAPTGGIIQYWLQWAFPGYYWPATTGTPTVADPA